MTCFKFIIHQAGWASQAVFFSANSILFILSAIGNSLIIYLAWSRTALRSPTYFLMSFLAMSDLLTSVFGQLPYSILSTAEESIGCTSDKAIAFVHGTNCTCSLLLLSLIARDRYLHISKRQQYLDYTSTRFAITASIACYLFGMVVATLFMFDDREIRISSTIVFAALGNSSFIYICFKSRQITRIVQDHNKQLEANNQNTSASEQIALTRCSKFEKAVNKSIFSVIILFFVSWTPVIILMIIFTVYNIRNEPIADEYRVAFGWASTVSYLNGALNPIIYAYRCDAIGREIRKIAAKIARKNSIAASTAQLDVVRKNAEVESSYVQ